MVREGEGENGGVGGKPKLALNHLTIICFSPPESYMRRVVKPLEALLTSHKRIIIKDSAVREGRGGMVGRRDCDD